MSCSPTAAAVGSRRRDASTTAPVPQIHDTRSERELFGQLQFESIATLRKERCAATEHEWLDEEPVLVDQVLLDELGREARAADRQVAIPNRWRATA